MLTGTYRKSSRSNMNGSCVAARLISDGVEMQDTKDRTGPTLRVPHAAWSAFAAAIKGGAGDGWGYGTPRR